MTGRKWVMPEPKCKKGPNVRQGVELMTEATRDKVRMVDPNVRAINVTLSKMFPSSPV